MLLLFGYLSQFAGFVQSVAVNLAFFASLSFYFPLLSFGEFKVCSHFVLTFGFTRCCYWRVYLYRRSSVYSAWRLYLYRRSSVYSAWRLYLYRRSSVYSAWRLYLYRRSSVYSAIRLLAGVDGRGLFGWLSFCRMFICFSIVLTFSSREFTVCSSSSMLSKFTSRCDASPPSIEESASPVLSLLCDNIRILSRSLVGRPFVIHSPNDHISLAAVCATTRCTARLSLY